MIRHLKHKIRGEAIAIALDRLYEDARRYAVEPRQVGIQDHLAASDDEDGLDDPLGGQRRLCLDGVTHVLRRFAKTGQVHGQYRADWLAR